MSVNLKSRGYERDGVLGHGGYGTVLRVVKNETNHKKVFGMKVIRLNNPSGGHGDGDSNADTAEQEIILHQRLRHPNIIAYVESFKDDNTGYLVIEAALNGDLSKFMDERKKNLLPEARQLPLETRQSWFRQLVLAVDHLHRHHVFHGDIKLKNILLAEDLTLKLCDFGSAIECNNPAGKIDIHQAKAHTPCYAAPELFLESSYDPSKADIFSMGCVLYELIQGEHPFADSGYFKEPHAVPNFATPEENDLLSKMLDHSPELRIDMVSLLNHPYVRVASASHNGQGDC